MYLQHFSNKHCHEIHVLDFQSRQNAALLYHSLHTDKIHISIQKAVKKDVFFHRFLLSIYHFGVFEVAVC